MVRQTSVAKRRQKSALWGATTGSKQVPPCWNTANPTTLFLELTFRRNYTISYFHSLIRSFTHSLTHSTTHTESFLGAGAESSMTSREGWIHLFLNLFCCSEQINIYSQKESWSFLLCFRTKELFCVFEYWTKLTLTDNRSLVVFCVIICLIETECILVFYNII